MNKRIIAAVAKTARVVQLLPEQIKLSFLALEQMANEGRGVDGGTSPAAWRKDPGGV